MSRDLLLESEKLKRLLELEFPNTELSEVIGSCAFDSVVEGICMNPGCDATYQCEPDARSNWCEICDSQSVKSVLVLAGII